MFGIGFCHVFTTDTLCGIHTVQSYSPNKSLLICEGDADCCNIYWHDFSHSAQAAAVMM